MCSIDSFLDQAGGPLITSPSVGFYVWCVKFLPENRHALAAGSEGNMVIVDTAAGNIVQRFQGHTGVVKSVAVSADWTHIVSCGTDGTVRVWDAASGAAMGEPLLGHEGQVWSVALSTDESWIVSCGFLTGRCGFGTR
jgi:WD40 repeat protein